MTTILERQDLIDQFSTLIGRPVTRTNAVHGTSPLKADLLNAVIAQAERHHLWAGKWQYEKSVLGPSPYPSQSEADFALLGEIARAAVRLGAPEVQLPDYILAAFERSGLYRPEKRNRVVKIDIPKIISGLGSQRRTAAQQPPTARRLTGGVISFSPTPPPPRDFVIQDLLLTGKPYVLAGFGGVSKTMWAMTAAVHVALGRSFMGKDTKPGCVLLLLGEEDQEEVDRRFGAIAHSAGLTADEVGVVRQRIRAFPLQGVDIRLTSKIDGQILPTDFVQEVTQVSAELQASTGCPVRLVIVDHAGLIHGGDFNAREDVVQTTAELQRMAALTGAASLCIGHSPKTSRNKDSADAGDITGSTAWIDHARGAFVLRTMTEAEARLLNVSAVTAASYVSFNVVKNNYGPSGSQFWFQKQSLPAYSVAALDFVNLAAQATANKAVPVHTRIKAFIAQNPGQYTRTRFRDQHGGKEKRFGISKSDLASSVDLLIRQGELQLVQPTEAQRHQYGLGPQVREVLEAAP